MADVLSRTSKRPYRASRTKKHIVEPRTAEQISKSVGVTKRDAALVRKVLLDLGYIQEEAPGSVTKDATATKRKKRLSSRRG